MKHMESIIEMENFYQSGRPNFYNQFLLTFSFSLIKLLIHLIFFIIFSKNHIMIKKKVTDRKTNNNRPFSAKKQITTEFFKQKKTSN